MKIYTTKNIYGWLLMFVFFGTSYAAVPTGLRIGDVKFEESSKELSITICNWDKRDQDLGDYQVWVSSGANKVKKTFSKNYNTNYSCGVTSLSIKDLGIERSGTFDIRIRLESVTGKFRDEKNSSFFIEYEKRFTVPKEPQTDIVIQGLEFDKDKKVITATVCNMGENYRISHKYYMSALFRYNNNKAKSILKEKDLWADACWTHDMAVKQLRISKPGTYIVEVISDSGNAVEEKTSKKYDTSKEENNRKQIEITIEEPKKIVRKVRSTKPTTAKTDMSSMSLRERIAFLREHKNEKNTVASTSNTRTTTSRVTRRRSLNYKPRTSRSTLESKYPYLFKR